MDARFTIPLGSLGTAPGPMGGILSISNLIQTGWDTETEQNLSSKGIRSHMDHNY